MGEMSVIRTIFEVSFGKVCFIYKPFLLLEDLEAM